VDKETLVRSDIEVGGLVLDALSRARIPITLCDWNYVPQLEEWQLVIATPWVDTRGRHEANARVLKALSVAGVYPSVPIRRVLVLSPHDPIAQALGREVRAKTEGAIHIIRAEQSYPTLGGGYSVIFAPFAGPGGAVPAKKIFGTEQLRQFLSSQLRISSAFVEEAIAELERKGSASIFHVQLTNKEAKKLGLA
jgi:hypothetical protein